jgi:hypothetical protein
MNTRTDPPRRDFQVVRPLFPLPAIRGVIDRRILVNFRCDPNVLARLVPPPFRLKLVHGFGMAGICLIRLQRIGPRWLTGAFGLSSENAAHRIAVEWDEAGERREGVFIPRRDTNSRLNELAGGRLFPGVHHHASFCVWESSHRNKIELNSDDRRTHVRIAARLAEAWPGGSVFASLDDASQFFRSGSLGWSARKGTGEFDGLELCTFTWKMEPLIVERIESSFFDDRTVFPKASVQFDSAFIMRGIEHEWHARGRMFRNNESRVL